ncbi:unnamed protein product [Lampetra planeri]
MLVLADAASIASGAGRSLLAPLQMCRRGAWCSSRGRPRRRLALLREPRYRRSPRVRRFIHAAYLADAGSEGAERSGDSGPSAGSRVFKSRVCCEFLQAGAVGVGAVEAAAQSTGMAAWRSTAAPRLISQPIPSRVAQTTTVDESWETRRRRPGRQRRLHAGDVLAAPPDAESPPTSQVATCPLVSPGRRVPCSTPPTRPRAHMGPAG